MKVKVGEFQNCNWRYNTQNNSADLLDKLHFPSFFGREDTPYQQV